VLIIAHPQVCRQWPKKMQKPESTLCRQARLYLKQGRNRKEESEKMEKRKQIQINTDVFGRDLSCRFKRVLL
jgi:hypothetical protein